MKHRIHSTIRPLAASALLLLTANATHAAPTDQLSNILNKATQARDNAKAAKESARELREKVQDGVQQLTGQVRDAIGAQAQVVRDMITVEFAGYDVFVSQHAQQFRAQIVSFLLDVQAVREEIDALTTGDCVPDVSLPNAGGLSALIALIEGAPDGVLYPVYKVGLPIECLIDPLRDAVESLQTIRAIVGGMDGLVGMNPSLAAVLGASDPETLDAELFAARLSSSRIYLENYAQLSNACGNLQKLGLALELVATKLKSSGETKTEGTLGVHGYAMVKISTNPRKSMGADLDSIAKYLGKLRGFVKGKLDNAINVSSLSLVLRNQEQILQNQQAMLDARR